MLLLLLSNGYVSSCATIFKYGRTTVDRVRKSHYITLVNKARICSLFVKVFPANDVLDIGTGLNDGLICFPATEVSGQDKHFLKPVKVQFVYSTIDVASLDEDLLPLGEEQPFTSKYGALLRSRKDSQGNQTWENVNNDATATIQRIQKDQLKISFSVEYFSK